MPRIMTNCAIVVCFCWVAAPHLPVGIKKKRGTSSLLILSSEVPARPDHKNKQQCPRRYVQTRNKVRNLIHITGIHCRTLLWADEFAGFKEAKTSVNKRFSITIYMLGLADAGIIEAFLSVLTDDSPPQTIPLQAFAVAKSQQFLQIYKNGYSLHDNHTERTCS